MSTLKPETRDKLKGVSTATLASILYKRGLRSQFIQDVRGRHCLVVLLGTSVFLGGDAESPIQGGLRSFALLHREPERGQQVRRETTSRPSHSPERDLIGCGHTLRQIGREKSRRRHVQGALRLRRHL